MGGSATPTGLLFVGQQSFTIRAVADEDGQEGLETFSIPLLITSLNLAVPVFAADPATISVIDRTGEGTNCVCITCILVVLYIYILYLLI